MIEKVFFVLSFSSVIVGLTTGNINEVSKAVITGAEKSVSVCFAIMGMMVLWNGILCVMKEAGLIRKLSKTLTPILKHVVPDAFKRNIATEEITACISANLLGMSNSATPLGIKAIEKLSESTDGTTVSNDMITLCILGCSCFNLVPTTLLAIRSASGAQINTEIIVPIWICSGTCMILGVFLSQIIAKLRG